MPTILLIYSTTRFTSLGTNQTSLVNHVKIMTHESNRD